jgi:hypothetical protein
MLGISVGDVVLISIPTGAYFLYKAIAGALMASASMGIEIERLKGTADDDRDTLGVTIKLSRNKNFAMRLLGGYVRVTHCILNDEETPIDEAWQTPIGVVPMHLKDARTIGGENHSWARRTLADVFQPFKDYRMSLAPGDKTSFAVFLQVPHKSACRIEANIAYEQWSWIPNRSRGALMASAVTLPG